MLGVAGVVGQLGVVRGLEGPGVARAEEVARVEEVARAEEVARKRLQRTLSSANATRMRMKKTKTKVRTHLRLCPLVEAAGEGGGRTPKAEREVEREVGGSALQATTLKISEMTAPAPATWRRRMDLMMDLILRASSSPITKSRRVCNCYRPRRRSPGHRLPDREIVVPREQSRRRRSRARNRSTCRLTLHRLKIQTIACRISRPWCRKRKRNERASWGERERMTVTIDTAMRLSYTGHLRGETGDES